MKKIKVSNIECEGGSVCGGRSRRRTMYSEGELGQETALVVRESRHDLRLIVLKQEATSQPARGEGQGQHVQTARTLRERKANQKQKLKIAWDCLTLHGEGEGMGGKQKSLRKV